MKQKAPRPEPQSNSRGLRVVIGQNSWNRVGLMVILSESGSVVFCFSEPVWEVEPELVFGGTAEEEEVEVTPSLSGFFSMSFWDFGVSRGPRTFR